MYSGSAAYYRPVGEPQSPNCPSHRHTAGSDTAGSDTATSKAPSSLPRAAGHQISAQTWGHTRDGSAISAMPDDAARDLLTPAAPPCPLRRSPPPQAAHPFRAVGRMGPRPHATGGGVPPHGEEAAAPPGDPPGGRRQARQKGIMARDQILAWQLQFQDRRGIARSGRLSGEGDAEDLERGVSGHAAQRRGARRAALRHAPALASSRCAGIERLVASRRKKAVRNHRESPQAVLQSSRRSHAGAPRPAGVEGARESSRAGTARAPRAKFRAMSRRQKPGRRPQAPPQRTADSGGPAARRGGGGSRRKRELW